jgi:alkylation response protein AidB-like acyl-CoA dehydrogenase
MQLALTEDQTMLAQTASAFVIEHSPVARLRHLRDTQNPLGYEKALYQQMAELGWTSIPFAERDGGLGLGMAGAIIVSEALGKTLAPEPYVPSILLAGQALALGGDEAQRARWLPALMDGSQVATLAYQETGSRYQLHRVTTRAQRTASGFRITGQKIQVQAGYGANAYVVSARTSGDERDEQGVSLFWVPADGAGVTTTRQWRIDSRNAAILDLVGVEVPSHCLLGTPDQGSTLLQRVVDRGTVGLCGEMLGGMNEAFQRTLTYLKERRQFGVPIGSFQALKHRAAKLFIEIELARSATMAAARALDEAHPDAEQLVCIAKARCSDAYTWIANEAVQLHGGIGMTDEHDIGFFMKHARCCELTYGDAAHHRERYARLSDY